MDHTRRGTESYPPSVKSPPPPYPDAFDPAAYGDSESLHTIQEHDRRYSITSVASEVVLPHVSSRARRATTASSGSEESSYTFGQPEHFHYRQHDPTIATPPSPPGRLSALDYPSDDRHSTYSYFPVDPADDPAVQRSIRAYPSPPASYYAPSNYAPSVNSQRSIPASSHQPRREPSQRSPTLIVSSGPTPQPSSPLSPQSNRPAPLLGIRTNISPCICTFRMTQERSMILAIENSADLTPLYKIEVFPNCFTPTSYITRVFRGSGGTYVGQFEMGISKDEPQLYMDQQWALLKDVFKNFRQVKSRLGDRWVWQRDKTKLHWDCRTEADISCYGGDDEKKVIAHFRPAGAQPLAATFHNGPPQSILEIYTAMDHSLLDDIVMSLLVVERRRASPRTGNENEKLFN